MLQAEIQERRAWLSKERFLEGLALVNTLPGAPVVQMCIFSGYQRAGWWGGVLAGLGFILPGFAIMLALAALHSAYGAVPFMRDAFYGLGPVVLGMFVVAVFRLGKNAIKDRFAIAIALAAAAAAALSPIGIVGTLLLAGCAGVALHHSRKQGLSAMLAAALLIAVERVAEPMLTGFGATGNSVPLAPGLWDIGAFFLKIGAVTFGGGMTILAFVQDQLVNQLQWITPQQFLDSLALGQITPGPMIMLAAYVGYELSGASGAAVAAFAIFLPSFIIMLSVLPVLERARRLAWVKAAMQGISPAVVGVISVAIFRLAPHAAPDAFTAVLLALTVLVMLKWRAPPVHALVCGGLVGVLVRSRLALRLREIAS